MLEARAGDAKRHIGACGVKPVSSFANRERPRISRGRGSISVRFSRLLEIQLQCKLQDARVARAGDSPKETDGRERSANAIKVCVVEDVEPLSPELEFGALAKFRVFKEGNIPALQSRAANRTSRRVTRGAGGIGEIRER